MEKRLPYLLTGLLWLAFSPLFSSIAQQLSINTVKYQVTYNPSTQVYTAWVVPDYSVPNSLNGGTVERSATAQFTLVVPRDFVITGVTDIRGVWAKPTDQGFIKLGPGNPNQDWPGLDPSLNYYVIGKTAVETNLGTFATGVPVALFSFVGNGCFGPIYPLPVADAFIPAADNLYSLNVANSFYSLSGQPAGGNVVPLEQFNGIVGGPANCAPPSTVVAIDDINLTFLNTPVSGNVLTNDFDPDGDAIILNLTPVVGPTNGTVVLSSNGSYTYTPNTNFVGEDSFIYSICDNGTPQACDAARVVILVLPTPVLAENSPPVAVNDNYQGVVNRPVTGVVLPNDFDPDDNLDPTSVTLVSGPTNGTLVLNPNGTFIYTPTTGFVGEDVFRYRVCDTGMPVLCDEANVTIRVNPQEVGTNLTFAVDDSYSGPQSVPVTGNVLDNDFDPEGDTQTARLVSGPLGGTLVLNPNGTFTYTPQPNFIGPDRFVYVACDNGSPTACDTATVYLLVYPVGSLGDFVWKDLNDNGIQDSNEPGVNGVTVNLWSANATTGAPISQLRSTQTSGNGRYVFDNLRTGDYIVQLDLSTLPDSCIVSSRRNGTNPALDNNFGTDGLSGVVRIEVLLGGLSKDNPTIDAGLVVACVRPVVASVVPTAATCVGTAVRSDGRIALSGISAGDRYSIATTVGGLAAYGSAIAFTGSSLTINSLPNPTGTTGQVYVIRIFNGSADCFTDVQVTLPFRACSEVCVKPVAGTDLFICAPQTTVSLSAAAFNEEWISWSQNPMGAAVNAQTGAVSGLTTDGLYAFILRDRALGSTCSDTVFVYRGTLTPNTFTTCDAGIQLPTVSNASWSVAPGTTAAISSTGLVSGMATPGTYTFVLTGAGCNTQVVVTRRDCTDPIFDVSVSKSVDKSIAMLGETVRYQLRVVNEGNRAVSGVVISDVLNAGVSFLGSTASVGSYDATTKRWTIGNLAVGQVVTLSIEVRVLAPGVWFNEAALIAINEDDINPANDKDQVCFTTPYLLCRGQGTSLELTVPSEYTGVVWFRKVQGGQPVQVGTGNRYVASEDALGSYEYTFTATQGTCPAEGCCPILVVVEDCCPVEICIPVTIQKRRR